MARFGVLKRDLAVVRPHDPHGSATIPSGTEVRYVPAMGWATVDGTLVPPEHVEEEGKPDDD